MTIAGPAVSLALAAGGAALACAGRLRAVAFAVCLVEVVRVALSAVAHAFGPSPGPPQPPLLRFLEGGFTELGAATYLIGDPPWGRFAFSVLNLAVAAACLWAVVRCTPEAGRRAAAVALGMMVGLPMWFFVLGPVLLP